MNLGGFLKMDLVDTLEHFDTTLKKAKSGERRRILTGAYKQLAESHKGRRANGVLRQLDANGDADSISVDSILIRDYVANALDKIGMVDHAARLRLQTSSAQMDLLQAHVGETVTYEHVWYGRMQYDEGKISEFTPFERIQIDCMSMPFIGYSGGIRGIAAPNGDVLFFNMGMTEDFDPRGPDCYKNMHEARRKVFGNAVPKTFVPPQEEKPPVITDEQLEAYVTEGRITPQQKEWIAVHENSWMGRCYVLPIAEAANALYKVVEKIEDHATLDRIAGEVVELSNHEVCSDELSKPTLEYALQSRYIMKKLGEQGHSGNSMFWALRKFIEVVREKKGVKYTSKIGLKNGAVFTLIPKEEARQEAPVEDAYQN